MMNPIYLNTQMSYGLFDRYTISKLWNTFEQELSPAMAFAVHTSGLMVWSNSALFWSLRDWFFSAMRANSGRFDSK
jgi:hypothetical protein